MDIICDIDGVICNPLEWVEKCIPGDWEEYFRHTLEFKPITPMTTLIQSLYEAKGLINTVFLVSGRPLSNIGLTRAWLAKYCPWWHVLKLRKDTDTRPTHEIKLEWYREIQPQIIFEDDPVVISEARKAGFPILQVHGYRLERAGSIGDGIPYSTRSGYKEEA